MSAGWARADDPPAGSDPSKIENGSAPADGTDAPQSLQTRPIDAGIVILNGRYVARPYVLRQEGEAISLNDHPLPLDNIEGLFWGRGGGGGWRPPPTEGFDRGWMRPRRNMLARIEHQLQNNSMLLGFRDGTTGFIPLGRDKEVLAALLAGIPNEEKIQRLVKTGIHWVSSAQWADLVETFQSDPELVAAFQAMKTAPPPRLPSDSAAPFASSDLIAYGSTMCALILVVYGMGTLMNHHPRPGRPWREIDAAGEDVPMLVRNVILVAVLGTFDLGCTLLAKQSSGFWELNPLGNHLLIEDPRALVGFKFASLLAGASILFWLRRYRGAQLAAWWLCLLCTIVAFRWATYNSMFLT
ncbi:MAG: hypothetical protein JW809_12805 [Pirellulales bacterium]|nr:hypothetical protein [Pirellulales bacterium]